jgi:hypothetical protein
MKRNTTSGLFFFLVSAVISSGCAPTPTASEPNDLRLTPSAIQLTQTQRTSSAKADLTCGCPFVLGIDGTIGDTQVISFNVPALGQTVSAFTIVATAKADAPAGAYTAKLALSAPGSNRETFRDTLTATITVQ